MQLYIWTAVSNNNNTINHIKFTMFGGNHPIWYEWNDECRIPSLAISLFSCKVTSAENNQNKHREHRPVKQYISLLTVPQ